ncbi:MAG: hypothetical protein MJK18_12805, partial [Bdellovibrionales bacterium]|nr:hypothetical protein [Bdellovibrionales bacterium]
PLLAMSLRLLRVYYKQRILSRELVRLFQLQRNPYRFSLKSTLVQVESTHRERLDESGLQAQPLSNTHYFDFSISIPIFSWIVNFL